MPTYSQEIPCKVKLIPKRLVRRYGKPIIDNLVPRRHEIATQACNVRLWQMENSILSLRLRKWLLKNWIHEESLIPRNTSFAIQKQGSIVHV